jgi:hypothetical protein
MYTGENRPVPAKARLTYSSNAAFGTIFIISNCFQRNKQKYLIIFLFRDQIPLKILIQGRDQWVISASSGGPSDTCSGSPLVSDNKKR